MKLIDKDALIAKIERLKDEYIKHSRNKFCVEWSCGTLDNILSFLNTLEVKDVDLVIHTIIAECCDWLAMCTNLSHDEIEGCRNLMLTVKDEQLKA